mmetsp:Transcript_49652/g.153325  ORF Transcript_49652/g.153325 Transcript_49652/m.153325 type:complete len:457 (+) Transcript_49652:187-1557(+)
MGVGSRAPHLPGRPGPLFVPQDLRLLQPVRVRPAEEIRAAAGHHPSRHHLPDALRAGPLPRLCCDVRSAGVQRSAEATAGIGWQEGGQRLGVHRPLESPGQALRVRAGLPGGRALRLLPQREDGRHQDAHLPRRPDLPKAAGGAAPRHQEIAGARVDRPAVGHRVFERHDLHGRRRGVHVAHGELRDRRGRQRGRQGQDHELPRHAREAPSVVRGMPLDLHGRGADRRDFVHLDDAAVPDRGQSQAAGVRALLEAALRGLPGCLPHPVVRDEVHGGGVRPLAALLLGPQGRVRGPARHRHPELLRHEDAHLLGDPMDDKAPHRGLPRLLRPVRAADLVLQRAPEAGGHHHHRPEGHGQHRPLLSALPRPLHHARLHGALDARPVPSCLRHHERGAEVPGADGLRRLHPGGQGRVSQLDVHAHLLDLRRDRPAARHLGPHELLPCDHRGRVRRGQGA